MEAKCNGSHFKVECKIDGVWYSDDFVFPDRATALSFKSHEESQGSGNDYRIVVTDAPVNLPSIDREAGDGEEEDGPPDEEDPSSLFDWSSFFDLAVLCPVPVGCAGDGDLERIYTQCCQGYSVVGEVFA